MPKQTPAQAGGQSGRAKRAPAASPAAGWSSRISWAESPIRHKERGGLAQEPICSGSGLGSEDKIAE
jgi:hypothetical protein